MHPEGVPQLIDFSHNVHGRLVRLVVEVGEGRRAGGFREEVGGGLVGVAIVVSQLAETPQVTLGCKETRRHF